MSFQRLATSLVISSSLVHVFCCGIPLLLSLTSLAALLGVSGGELIDHAWFEQYEVSLLVISGVVLACAALAHIISRAINCRKDGACTHKPCESKKDISGRILFICTAIYAVNMVLFFAHH